MVRTVILYTINNTVFFAMKDKDFFFFLMLLLFLAMSCPINLYMKED